MRQRHSEFGWGGDSHPASQPQYQEDHPADKPIYHDEPDYEPGSGDYSFFYGNGQLHVAPEGDFDHDELRQHAGVSEGHSGPIAVGHVTVDHGRATWHVSSNVGIRSLHRVLSDYTKKVGWRWHGLTDIGGAPFSDDFAPKKSMALRDNQTGELLRFTLQGKTAHVSDLSEEQVEAVKAAGYKVAEYPGGTNMNDRLRVNDPMGETLEMFDRNPMNNHTGPTNLRDHRQPSGTFKCPGCSQIFPNWQRYMDHRRQEEPPGDKLPKEDGKFPPVPNMDLTLVPKYKERTDFTFPLASVKEAERHADWNEFINVEGARVYGAFRAGELRGFAVVRAERGSPARISHIAGSESTQYDLVRKVQLHYPAVETDSSTLAAGLPERLGMVRVAAGLHRWAAGQEPKDMISSPVPFIFDVQEDRVDVGQPGERHSDIEGQMKFTPGGIVEGVYEPGGKIVLRNRTTIPYTVRHLIDLWYWTHPHMKVTGVERETDDGNTQKLAATRDTMYHIAPQSAREQIETNGLEPRWGGGQATGQSPFSGTMANLKGVYLSDYPGLIGLRDHSPWENLSGGPHDIWEVDTRGATLHPDFPALGEHGAYAESDHFWFDEGGDSEADKLHEQFGDRIGYHDAIANPHPFIQFTGTATVPHPIEPERLRRREMSEFGPSKPMPVAKTAAEVGAYVKTIAATDPAVWNAYQALAREGGKVYAVGGVVRDALMHLEPKDVDLMVGGLPSEVVGHILEKLPGRVDITGKSFGVFRYNFKGHEVEIALPRTETSTGDKRKDFDVKVDHNLPVEDDLLRRDFTVNSMAVEMDTGKLVDPFEGAKDIKEHRLRTTHPSSFVEDPTRILRGLVMHGRYGFVPDEQTRGEMSQYRDRLDRESWDNMNGILEKIMVSKDPARAMRLAQETGVMAHIFPEVHTHFDYDQNNPHHNYTLGEHLLNVLENTSQVSKDPDLRMAALLHDIGKPDSAWVDPEKGTTHYYHGKDGQGADHEIVGAEMAKNRLRAVRWGSKARIDRIEHLIKHHMWPAFSSPKGARKFLHRVGDDHADDLMTLRWADQRGKGQGPEELAARTHIDAQRGLVEQVRSVQAPTTQSALAINGSDILALGVPAGPEVGRILRHLTDDVVEDPALNDPALLKERAQEYAQATA